MNSIACEVTTKGREVQGIRVVRVVIGAVSPPGQISRSSHSWHPHGPSSRNCEATCAIYELAKGRVVHEESHARLLHLAVRSP